MDQGSNAWLDWRNQGIGSSDAPVIMGAGYSTVRELAQIKMGLVKPIHDPGKMWVFEKGHKIEKQARAYLEIIHGGIEFRAGLVQMKDYPIFRSSLDGANFTEHVGKEIKFVSKKEFDEGVCPVRYYPQIQHQYLCTYPDLTTIDIVLCCEVGKLKQLKIKEVPVPINIPYILNEYVPRALNFWWHVENGILPGYTSGDAVRIKDKAIIEKIKKEKSLQKKAEKLRQQWLDLGMQRDEICHQIKHDLNDAGLNYSYYQKTIYRIEEVKTLSVSLECF